MGSAIIEALCWVVPAVSLLVGCWLCARAIGMERALRQRGGWPHAWKLGKR